MLRAKVFSLYVVFCDFQGSLDDTQLGICSSEGFSFVLTQNGDFGLCSSDSETELIDIVGSACCSV